MILAGLVVLTNLLFSQQNFNTDSLQKVIKTSKDDISVIMSMIMVGDKIYITYPDSALRIFDKAERMALKTIKNTSASDPIVRQLQKYLAFSYYDRGVIYDQKGDPLKALSYYNQALKIYESTDRKYGIAGVLNSIGHIYKTDLNDTSRALDCYKKALNLYEELGDTLNTAVILANVGSIYKMKGNIAFAKQYYSKSLRINEKLNNARGIALVSMFLAEMYKDEGRTEEARLAANRSLKLYNESGDKEGSADAMVLLGDVYFIQGNISKAREMASEALHIAERNNYRNIIKEAAFLLKKIFKEQDKYEEALRMNDLYNSMRDTIENKDVQTQMIRDMIYFENRNKALVDSVKFVTEQQEKDNKIRQQQILIDGQRKLRNAFFVIGFFIVIGGLLLFNRYRLGQKLRQNELQVNSLETQQKLLRAQMNPHFINNALNSIQSLILGNETSQAGEYLATFSRLTRAILEQTTKKSIPLSKEVETLGMYLEMEKLRFDNKFDYEILVHDSINPEAVSIPPLLIQPFAENSILHGIIHKGGKGKVKIEFEQKDETLTCTIEDNGVGRARSREINSKKTKTGSSIATQLAQNRLSLINTNGKQGISIIDLVDEAGNASGTRVVLTIPLISTYDKSHTG